MSALNKTLLNQWQLFCLAVMFFTRLPVPSSIPYSPELMNKANRYFSLVGLLVALILVLCYSLLSAYFPHEITLVLLMIISVALTGAFHEDGLADMADGIGGGMTPEKRLTIMKDSRLGTYGSITLILALALKYALWSDLAANALLIPSMVLAYTLSRALSSSLIFNTPYVSDTDTSKSKPLASQQGVAELIFGLFIGVLPLALFVDATNFGQLLLVLLVTLVLFRSAFRGWLLKRLNGFTGDCLGAAQQISELLIYLVVVALVSNFGSASPWWLIEVRP